MASEDDMQIISAIAKQLHISYSKLRLWCRTGLINGAELRETKPNVLAWYATVSAVRERLENPPKMGRPSKNA